MRRGGLLGFVMVGLLGAVPVWAAQEILWIPDGAPVTFADTAQAPTVKLTLAALATQQARVSAVWDRGAGALASDIAYRCTIQHTGTLVTTEADELWLATSDGTTIDGPVTADSTITNTAGADRPLVASLRLGAQLRVNKTTSNTAMTYSGIIHDVPDARYLYLVFWNMTAFSVRNDVNVNSCVLQPIVPQVQP